MKTFMSRCASVLASIFCCSAFAHQAVRIATWLPTAEQVKEIEAQITMPAGTTLTDYSRYYSGRFEHGHRQLIGVFVKGETKPGAYIVTPEKSPKIFDGGCSIVNFSYDMTTHKTLSIFCNGVG
ncbi:MAG: hypothetical protein WBG81_05295 [Rhodanobacter sp.]|jgi:hypothetical protein|uniref:hypothetical protein n=1 Tax=Rhodanobacter sp. KK11 TaxID=3083255 RepID=UPI002965F0F8|nr:hypothetical protein [Rhodanobacter sp. KK11]MDW2980138.1 hypothetical protein [Rhodanobacter sp. KK11]